MAFDWTKEKEKKFWASYARVYPYWERSRLYQRLLDDIKKWINPKANGRWLDVGSGPGTVIEKVILPKIQGKLKEIIGIDFEDAMLGIATQKLAGHPEVKFQNVDLSQKTPFPAEFFDGIIANLVLTYVRNFENKKGREALEGTLSEMYRILKPGGTFIWSTPRKDMNSLRAFIASLPDIFNLRHPENLYYGPAIFRYSRTIQKLGRLGIYNFLEKEELIEIMKQIGFSNIRLKFELAGQVWLFKAIKQHS
jgi:ubiquinone/menaquinone biosynthesis C-methylase UbiE